MHIVNKKIAEMLIVCLPCHFGYGKSPVPYARGTPLAVLDDMQILTMTRTCLDPKLSSMQSGPRTQGTRDFQSMVSQANNSEWTSLSP